MNKVLITALGLGAAYLLKNKDARQKLMSKVQSFTGMNKRNG